MNPLLPLSRHGVRWGIWRNGVLRIATSDTHGAPTEQRLPGMIQRAHTADRLFSSVVVVQNRRLVFAQMSSTLIPDKRAMERNTLIFSIGLSLLLPEWAERGAWLVQGLQLVNTYGLQLDAHDRLRIMDELNGRDDDPQHGVSAVAWPAPHIRARLSVSPAPAAFVHCTVTWRD